VPHVAAQETDNDGLSAQSVALVEASDGRVTDPDILFNAGLGYADRGDFGASVLWLERAQLASPLDREVFDARQRIQESARRRHASSSGSFHFGEPAGVSWWRTFRALPLLAIQVLVILSAWLVGGVGMFWLLHGRPESGSTQATTQWSGLIIGTLLLLAGGGYAMGRTVLTRNVEPMVLMQERPSYREAPDELATTRRHSDMYAGAVVLQLERRDGWVRVELAGGDAVWVSSTHVEAIE
jgi:hypothetical protein